jgi:hypothetical protein
MNEIKLKKFTGGQVAAAATNGPIERGVVSFFPTTSVSFAYFIGTSPSRWSILEADEIRHRLVLYL